MQIGEFTNFTYQYFLSLIFNIKSNNKRGHLRKETPSTQFSAFYHLGIVECRSTARRGHVATIGHSSYDFLVGQHYLHCQWH